MPSKKAKELCPDVIFVYPRFEAYKEASRKIREIFQRYTDLIEPLSLDEAFLDVTEDKLGIGSAMEIASEIKQAIKEETGLTASAGVSSSKFVAKICSDLQKPDGLTFIGPSKIEAFMEKLPVERFFGVGKVTADRMKKMGLHTGADLKAMTEQDLIHYFGKAGKFFYKIVRGIDNREVQPHREHKSMGAEDTFSYDLTELEEMNEQLEKIANTVCKRLEKYNLKGRTLTLKIKYHDFKQITRNHSFDKLINDYETIVTTAKQLLLNTDLTNKKIRLLGISLSNFIELDAPVKKKKTNGQLELF
jgi:DNA polymerase-4